MTRNSPFDLHGRTVLLTGSTGHLGKEIARSLARQGAHVLVNSRSQTKCNQLVSALTAEGYSAEPAVFNVAINAEVNSFFSNRHELPLNGIINNAYSGTSGSLELSHPDAYTASYSVSVVAAHNLLQAALPSLRLAATRCGDASVINIASMYALVSPDQRMYDSKRTVNPPFYGAAKAALLQWTRYAACEFGPEGIRVNSISPGPFPSTQTQIDSPSFLKALEHRVPLGRIGKAEEMSGPVIFLASSASTFVNGSNIVVDGGWTCW